MALYNRLADSSAGLVSQLVRGIINHVAVNVEVVTSAGPDGLRQQVCLAAREAAIAHAALTSLRHCCSVTGAACLADAASMLHQTGTPHLLRGRRCSTGVVNCVHDVTGSLLQARLVSHQLRIDSCACSTQRRNHILQTP